MQLIHDNKRFALISYNGIGPLLTTCTLRDQKYQI